jgi:hypothetical protein
LKQADDKAFWLKVRGFWLKELSLRRLFRAALARLRYNETMTVPFEEEYQDVLQNIEFAIVSVDRERDDLSDWGVGEALDALIRHYGAEARGRGAPPLRLSEPEEEVFERVKAMCEWRLGRRAMLTSDDEPIPGPEPLELEEIVACLKRVRLSVKRWSKEGRRGYLDFVGQFLP